MRITIPGILLLATLAAGCGEHDASKEVVVFVSHDRVFSEPVLRDFEASSGLKVRIVTDTEATKTTGLVNRLLMRKDRAEADVFWNNEVGQTLVLAERGVLAPYRPKAAADIPAGLRDPQDRWTGFAARARVILYNTSMVSKAQAPTSIFDLVKPRWKGQVAVAIPLFGTTRTHFAALFAALGPEKAQAFMRGLRDNEVAWVAGNAVARNQVMDGQIAVCLTDTDDANGAFLKGKPVEMVFPDQGAEGLGALFVPNTVMLIKGGPNPTGGQRLVEYLLSREVEARLAASKAAQIPVREGVATHNARFSGVGVKRMAVAPTAIAAQFDAMVDFYRKEIQR